MPGGLDSMEIFTPIRMSHKSPKTSIEDVDDELELDISPNLTLTRVGSHFIPASAHERSPTSNASDSGFGSLASVGRFCNDADEIIYQDSPIPQIPVSSNVWQLTGEGAHERAASKESPVYLPWPSLESKRGHIDESFGLNELPELFQTRVQIGSSLAPQSSGTSSDISTGGHRLQTEIQRAIPRALYTEAAGTINRAGFVDGRPMSAQVILPQPRLLPQKHLLSDPLRCNECGKSFHRRSDLIHHTRYHIRSSDRPYKCDECGHGFLHKKDLDRHMPRHTGQKLFRCSIPGCPKTYTRKDNLSRHIRHDHAEGSSLLPATVNDDLSAPDSANEGYDMLENGRDSDSGSTPDGVLEERPSLETGSRAHKRRAEDEATRPEARPAKRPPRKSPLKHRLACPYRKCSPQQFSSQPRFKVCATTPHEYMRRVVDHMDRNHQISVCGKCFFAFSSVEFLHQHKENCEHCTKCYLPFSNLDALSAHTANCKPVESSGSQEDAWQIMYETLCGDEKRHNPSFDHNGPFDKSIPPNNMARMEYIKQLAPLPGQVNSLYKEMISPSGKEKAPSAIDSDGKAQKPIPAALGALNLLAGLQPTEHVQSLELENPQLRAYKQHSQSRITSLETSVVAHKAIGARKLSSLRDFIFQPSTSLPASSSATYHLLLGQQSIFADGTVGTESFQSDAFGVWTSKYRPASEDGSSCQFDFRHSIDASCPSLVSDSTTVTQELIHPAHRETQYCSIGGQDSKSSIKEKASDYGFTWHTLSLENHAVPPLVGLGEEVARTVREPPNIIDPAIREYECPECHTRHNSEWSDTCRLRQSSS